MHPASDTARQNSSNEQVVTTTNSLKFVKFNGLRIACESFGNPQHQTVLLIMGMGAQMLVWPDALCQLIASRGFYVIRFDNRDIGLSSKSQGRVPGLVSGFCGSLLGIPVTAPYTLWDMAADCRDLLAALRRPRAHIVGSSMGGMIGQIFAVRYPERTISLSLIMSDSGYSGLPSKDLNLLRTLLSKPPTSATPNELIHHKLKIIKSIGSKSFPGASGELVARLQKVLSRSSDDAVGALRHCAAVMATGSLKQLQLLIKAPTLILHGDEDPLIPPARSQAMAGRIRHAKFEVIAGMGHDFPSPLLARIGKSLSEHLMDPR